MAIEVKVPLLPESVSDATVSTWHKKAGDRVSRDENIVDLETDKVMLEVPSPSDGILKEIIKPTGSTVNANDVIAIIEAVAAGTQPAAEKAAAKPESSQTPASQTPAQRPTEPRPPGSAQVQSSASLAKKDSSVATKEAPLSPSARRAVAEHEVDVSGIAGTGKGGRITKENVLSVATTGMTGGARPEKRVRFLPDRCARHWEKS